MSITINYQLSTINQMFPIYLMIGLTIILMAVAIFFLNKKNDEKIFIDLAYKLTTLQVEIQRIENAVKTEIGINRKETFDNAANARNELANSLDAFKKDFLQAIKDFNALQKDNFYALLNKQSEQNTDTSNKLDSMRQTLEKKIGDMQQGNEQKLEQMRITVDEKLQHTLETRLGESFKLISERLEAVHKGLGDMQQLGEMNDDEE